MSFSEASFNAVMNSQQFLEQGYLPNMENLYTPGAVETNVYFTDYYNAAQCGGIAPRYAVKELNFSQGKLGKTKSPTDLAIEGNGFFVVTDGVKDVYTRNGKFAIKDGVLTHPNGLKVKGYVLDEAGQIKGEPTTIEMGLDPQTKLFGGKYTGYKFDEAGIMYGQITEVDPVTKNAVTSESPIYQVAMASFANPSGLKPVGLAVFAPTENSGPAVLGLAGEGSLGAIKPQHLEMTNIDYIQQTYKASRAKQSHSANFAVIKAQDEITKMSINLIK